MDKQGKDSEGKSSEDDGNQDKDLETLKLAKNEVPKDVGK